MFYMIYKTTCTLNGKIYIGMHKTKKLDDGYLGSGKLLTKAITAHGKENFVREIIAFYDSEKDMIAAEKSIVTEDFCALQHTYNLCPGGNGGAIRKGSKLSDETRSRISASVKKHFESMELLEKRKVYRYDNRNKWNDEQKAKHKALKQGYVWMTDGAKDKMIKSEDQESYISLGWRRGRSHPPHNKKA